MSCCGMDRRGPNWFTRHPTANLIEPDYRQEAELLAELAAIQQCAFLGTLQF